MELVWYVTSNYATADLLFLDNKSLTIYMLNVMIKGMLRCTRKRMQLKGAVYHHNASGKKDTRKNC
jgi:hypothetical protein